MKEKDEENHKYAAKILYTKDNFFDIKIEMIKKIQNLKNPYIINYIISNKGIIKNEDNYDIIKQYIIYEYAPKKNFI